MSPFLMVWAIGGLLFGLVFATGFGFGLGFGLGVTATEGLGRVAVLPTGGVTTGRLGTVRDGCGVIVVVATGGKVLAGVGSVGVVLATAVDVLLLLLRHHFPLLLSSAQRST